MRKTLRKKAWLSTAIGLVFCLPWAQGQDHSYARVNAASGKAPVKQKVQATYVLQDVLNKLESSHKVRFMYDPELIKSKYITKSEHDLKKGKLESELNQVLAPLQLICKHSADPLFE